MAAVLETLRTNRKRKMEKDARYTLVALHCRINYHLGHSFDDRKKKRKTTAKKVNHEICCNARSQTPFAANGLTAISRSKC